jgi:hypothetical protein
MYVHYKGRKCVCVCVCMYVTRAGAHNVCTLKGQSTQCVRSEGRTPQCVYVIRTTRMCVSAGGQNIIVYFVQFIY